MRLKLAIVLLLAMMVLLIPFMLVFASANEPVNIDTKTHQVKKPPISGSYPDFDFTGLNVVGVGGGAPTTAHFVTTKAEAALSNAFSLGALTNGLLKNTVAAGVSTPVIAVAKTDYWDTTDFKASGGSHAHGLVPDPGATAGNSNFVREDGTFARPVTGLTLNVKDKPYNAAGDGSTDDTTAIQTAINDLSAAGGGVLFFPEGTYVCNGAFDGTTNSILKFPYVSNTGVPLAVMLLGQSGTGSYSVVSGSANGAVIRSSKVGTGTHPALLAANAYIGTGFLTPTQFNYTSVYIKNLTFFLDDDPTIDGVRLDAAAWATLEDVIIQTATAAQPTHSTVGLWMPNSGNGAYSYCNHTNVIGFDTGLRVGEHFRGPNAQVQRCNVAMEFLVADEPSWANVLFFQCINQFKFSGNHQVELFADIEIDPSSHWYSAGTSIIDVSSYGTGEIRYTQNQTGLGPITAMLTASGGLKLRLYNFYTNQFESFIDHTITASSASTTGTQLLLTNTSASGLTWALISEGSAQSVGHFGLYNGTNTVLDLSGTKAGTHGSGYLGWWSDPTYAGVGSFDTALYRNAAGVVEVNNGTAGTFRDIKPRAVQYGGVTYANLSSASAGVVSYVTDGNASNCGDAACTTWGTTVTGGGGALKLLVWYNGSNWTLLGK